MWTKKTRWKVAMRNFGKILKILLNLIMASNDAWTNKCVLTMTMSHTYGHTFSHLSICSIVLNVQDVKVGAGVQKMLIANSFWALQHQQWNFHQFVFVLLLLLSSSCSFYEVHEHFSETSELMHLIFCKILLTESCCPLLDLTYAAVYFTLVSFLQQNGHVDFAERSCRFRLVFLWDENVRVLMGLPNSTFEQLPNLGQ